jgi:hypothetical protein
MPISAAERERVESGVQMAQNQFLESLELPGCVATIEAVRQDPLASKLFSKNSRSKKLQSKQIIR